MYSYYKVIENNPTRYNNKNIYTQNFYICMYSNSRNFVKFIYLQININTIIMKSALKMFFKEECIIKERKLLVLLLKRFKMK